MRYQLHAGEGRTWHHQDTALAEYKVDQDDDWRLLKARAQKLQDKYDWWDIFDADDGMCVVCGWMTGRTTPHLMAARNVPPLPRHVRSL